MNSSAKGRFEKGRGYGTRFEDIVILGGARTPFGAFMGTLSGINPTDLGIVASRAALEKTGVDPAEINQVVYANITQCGTDAYYVPRHIALYCGVPADVPAMMVQRLCGSGFQSVATAAEQIALGNADLVLAGGTENMSLSPTVSFGNRSGYPLGRIAFYDMLWESLRDPSRQVAMGDTAEILAEEHGIGREEVDAFALSSQRRYAAARDDGFFEGEIVPVRPGAIEQEGYAPRRIRLAKRAEELARDEHPQETSLEKLAALKPSFRKGGVQTAGNSSGICDGAASLLIARGQWARERGYEPIGRLLSSAAAGVDPRIMGIGPVPASRLALELAGLEIDAIDAVEINEAFGAQYLAVERELGLDRAKTNPNGGALAIGHPLAATGTRLTLTCLRELRRRGGRHGLVSACIGGGQGMTLVIEAL